jgi:endonuclease YncB( thermonuclease family)
MENCTYQNTPAFSPSGYEGPARVLDLCDGDTLWVAAPFLGGPVRRVKVRLARIDAPELDCEEGQTCKAWVARLLLKDAADGLDGSRKSSRAAFARVQSMVHLKTTGCDKYGRALGEVFVDGTCLNDSLVEEGYAKNYGH